MAFTRLTSHLSAIGPSEGRSQIPVIPSNCTRLSLLAALSSQVFSRSQQGVHDVITEIVKYVNPSKSKQSSPRNLEEALMTVPDLETVPYQLIRKNNQYEVRRLESYLVAETLVPSERGFDLYGSSQAFNTIAAYLFGKNENKQEMAMTTPVFVSKENDGWRMGFVMASKYNEETVPAPINNEVEIRRVDPSLVAVVSFSGYVSDEEVTRREKKLRKLLETDFDYRVKSSARPQVAQYNPPFTPPCFRRNELILEVEPK